MKPFRFNSRLYEMQDERCAGGERELDQMRKFIFFFFFANGAQMPMEARYFLKQAGSSRVLGFEFSLPAKSHT